MRISISFSSLKETTWHEYALRFLFGGIITVATGLIAKRYGAAVGGLFLAFPAIFPASVTLVEKHVAEQKQVTGRSGKKRGRKAASVDSAGAAIGSLGLAAFGLVVWKFLPGASAGFVLLKATVAWFIVAASLWWLRSRF